MARIASVLNFWGALCFFIAYIVDYNRTADEHEWVEIYFVAGTFTVGSIFFAIASWIGLWMWKTEQVCAAELVRSLRVALPVVLVAVCIF